MIRVGVIALLVAVTAFIIGFWKFADRVRERPETPPQAEAIVALTGGSSERLSTGVRLLEEHKGERLLISGVNRIVTDNELYEALHIDPALGECCIDIGRSADDTLGMPRSQAELSVAMPEAEIHPYPVRTRFTDPVTWRSDLGAAGRLGAEYVKYLVITGREALIDLGTKDQAKQDAHV
jgi:uncharacterized SAM-binding protein YcdF (DUF218 family)